MRLSLAAIDQLPEGIAEPGYDPTAYGVGIVHMGIGAFHRCHMAVYTDDVLAENGGDWRILGVSLRSSKIRDQLEPQNGLYTVIVRGASGDRAQVIGSVAGVLWAPADPQRVLEAMSAASTKIISLTITEKAIAWIRRPGLSIRRIPIFSTIWSIWARRNQPLVIWWLRSRGGGVTGLAR